MTNIEESSKPYLRLLSESDAGSDEISAQVALLFRQLYSAYPDPVDEPALAADISDRDLGRQIVNWLNSEHFIKVEGAHVWLTFTGCETIRRTCRTAPVYLSFFEAAGSPPPVHSTELVLALLKTHFHRGRAAGR